MNRQPIQLLPREIVEKIAAGEVIENPASVAKELVENSLDAHAHHITVEIGGAGKELIQVTDDGIGIPADQLLMAVAAHATSKLQSLDDLQQLHTLGFRGEALSSIAAVSRFQIVSRPADAAQASTLTVEGGRPAADGVQPAGAPLGTTVRVQELFFNTPVRYRFLRQDPAERRALIEVVSQLALVHPEVHFRLLAEGEEVFATPGDGSLSTAARVVWGDPVADQLLPLPTDAGAGWSLDGLIAAPGLHRAYRHDEVFALNGRVVEVRSLRVALERAYESQLPPRRYPVAVVRLQVDPAQVDVNVHPTKREVRLQEESALFRAVRYACVRALQEWAGTSQRFQIPVGRVGQRDGPGVSAAGDEAPVPPADAGALGEDPVAYLATTGEQRGDKKEEKEKREERTEERGSGPSGPAEGVGRPVQGSTREGRFDEALAHLRIIGQLHQAFIVGETPTALWLIDQHIAHERVLFEALAHEYEQAQQSGQAAPSQELLLPATVEVPAGTLSGRDETGLWEQLRQVGFHCEPFGPRRILVRTVPLAWERLGREPAQPGQVEAAIGEILTRCLQGGPSDRLHHIWATLACKAAVKAGEYLSAPQMEQLVRQLALCQNPYACPHGRPIMLRVGREDLLRGFGRPVRPAAS